MVYKNKKALYNSKYYSSSTTTGILCLADLVHDILKNRDPPSLLTAKRRESGGGALCPPIKFFFKYRPQI